MPCGVTSMAVMSRIAKSKSVSMETKNLEEVQENICVVCFKGVEIYSIGQCDHPVCFECSTRMRVLCRQNECPICRQDMPTVVFTKNIRPFKLLKNINVLTDKKFKIVFDNEGVKAAYHKLLDHACPKCPDKSFSTFNQLKDHVRRTHQMSYCELCVANLKIFSFERRIYTRQELVHHRREGDPDDKSHKGHPLCEFCDIRYMDNDELYRHLRLIHLYCHICDADGYHRYFSNYVFLREHFKKEHYLCEEGACPEEELTSVFRTEIDLKAHRASVHGRSMGKVGLKQARTIALEFTLAPRPRASVSTRLQPGRSHNNHTREEEIENNQAVEEVEQVLNQVDLNTDCIEEFPCLSGGNPSGVNNSNRVIVRSSRVPMRPRAMLTVNDENFPALAGGSGSTNSAGNPAPSNSVSRSTTATTVCQSRPSTCNSSRTSSAAQVSIHLRGGPGLSAKFNHREDFPALSTNMSPCSSNTQWAPPPRPTEPKVNLVKPPPPKPKPPTSFSMDTAQFPSLLSQPATNTSDPPETSKKSKLKNKPTKSALTSTLVNSNKQEQPNEKSKKKPKKSTKKEESKLKNNQKDEVRRSTEGEYKGKNILHKSEDGKKEEEENVEEENGEHRTLLKNEDFPQLGCRPPGFVPPPPGFEVSCRSKAPPPGFNGHVSTSHSYLAPRNFSKRNKKLVGEVVNSVGGEDFLDEFKRVSGAFRSGVVSASDYVEHCTHIMGQPAFHSLFPELLALLPDISKQQELWTVVESRVKETLERCEVCHQVVSKSDISEHLVAHSTPFSSPNFPPLPQSLFLAQDTAANS